MLKKSIYKIENLNNGKIYIGQSIHPHRRLIEHMYMARHHLDDLPIHLAIAKYKEECFSFTIIEEDIENYNEREAYWIAHYNSLVPNGYNILPGGQSTPVLKGENHPRNTITKTQVEDIVEYLLFSNFSQRQIAEVVGTTERIVNSINKGETHSLEGYNYPLRRKCCHYSQKTLEQIYWLLEYSDASLDSIANFFGLTKGNISQINLGKILKTEREYPIRPNAGVPRDKQEILSFLFERENTDLQYLTEHSKIFEGKENVNAN
jgi:group I intron endonuclease